MNAVPVDDAEIQATLDAVAGEYIPKDAPGPEIPPQAPPPPDFGMAAACIVVIVDKVVAPNWELTDGEKDLLQTQLSNVATIYAPTVTLNPRAVAVFGLVGACFAIALGRIDEDGLRPMRKPKPDEVQNDVARAEPAEAGGVGFRTAA
jgi:hypothetical protein